MSIQDTENIQLTYISRYYTCLLNCIISYIDLYKIGKIELPKLLQTLNRLFLAGEFEGTNFSWEWINNCETLNQVIISNNTEINSEKVIPIIKRMRKSTVKKLKSFDQGHFYDNNMSLDNNYRT
jgi:hypothetical protein